MTIEYNFIYFAVVMIAFDIITGVFSSFVTGTFQSSMMRKGGLHKLFLIIVITFGVAIDFGQYLIDLGISLPATSTICVYIGLMEILSCVENINKAYPNALPKQLLNILNDVARDNGVEDNE